MKIAIFTNNYLPNPYGVSTSIETFRQEFEKKGHTVYIFAPMNPGYVDENPHVFRYPSVETNFKMRFSLAVPFSFRMDKIIRKLDLDIIHAQHPNLLAHAAKKWARKKKIPLVFTWHSLYDKYVNYAPIINSEIAKKYIIRQAVKMADASDAVIVPTDSIIKILRAWGVKNKNIFPVPTGVQEELFQNPDKGSIRKKFGLSDSDIVILTISRLTEEKNVEFILRSIEMILDGADASIKNSLKFIVGGEGYSKNKLEQFAKDKDIAERIIFSGLVGHQELKDYFAASDIFVYASKSETQGMVVSEAMFCGLPIVAVNATGVSSLVLHKGNGFLVKEDENDFSQAVLKLAADKDLRQKFSQISRKIARDNFTSLVTAEKLLAVYASLIESKTKEKVGIF